MRLARTYDEKKRRRRRRAHRPIRLAKTYQRRGERVGIPRELHERRIGKILRVRQSRATDGPSTAEEKNQSET